MFKRIEEDFSVIFNRDPAARSRLEIVFCYPGFQAIQFYRLAHWLWNIGFRFAGRLVSHLGRMITGIEIHPAAKIGKGLFIDHGMGVVIGETAIIENDVTLYHGVTLGGVAPVDELDRKQRHPHIKNGVIIGAGAQLLGAIVVGQNARIGSNAVVVRDVPENSIMVGVPAHRAVKRQYDKEPCGDADNFDAYASGSAQNDPLLRSIKELQNEMRKLQNEIAELREHNNSSEETANIMGV